MGKVIQMSDIKTRQEADKPQTQVVRMSDLPAVGYSRKVYDEPVRRYAQNKYLYTKIPNRPYVNRRVFVIGGGPSLKGFDFKKLNGEIVIAVNRAWESTNCAFTFFLDEQFWGWTDNGTFGKDKPAKWLEHPSYKITVNRAGFPYPEDISVIDFNGSAKFPESIKTGIYCGSNSGFAATNLAIALGSREIYLLGFDMDNETDPYDIMNHFHSGYPEKQNNTSFNMFKYEFDELAHYVKGENVKITNLNKDSKMRAFPFGEFNDIPKIKRPIITSFYSPDYTGLSQRMRKSVNLFGFETDIKAIDKQGTWVDTMYLRAQFVKDMLLKHKRDIVWLDCDAVMYKYPELFDNFKGDFGVHYKGGAELLGGTMYFAYKPKTLELVDKWIELNKTIPKQQLTQVVLQKAVESWNGKLVKLPAGYTLIYDLMAGEDEPVIEHYQASRIYRYA